jgi:hypothetical protein
MRKFFVYFELNRISNIPLFQASIAHSTLVWDVFWIKTIIPKTKSATIEIWVKRDQTSIICGNHNGRHKAELRMERDIQNLKDKKHGSRQYKIYSGVQLNPYCVFCLSSSCVSYTASFSGLSIVDCPIGRTNNDLQNITRKTNDRATRIGGELRCSGMVTVLAPLVTPSCYC